MIDPLEKLYVKIDPLALLLPPSVYAKIVEKFHPHVPKVADIAEVLKGATAAERKEVVSRVAAVGSCIKAVEEANAKFK